MKSKLQSLLYPLSSRLPSSWLFNYLIAVLFFIAGNRRLPRSPDADDAEVNDFIFHRMIANAWTSLELQCVDKELAKASASRVTSVKVARTAAVFKLRDATRISDFITWIQPHLGKRLVAKPTHGSGTVLFLDRDTSDAALEEFFRRSNRNFFHTARETQYRDLEPKILIEENIATTDNINDYKFFCVKGHVLYCQVDVDRFTHHKRALYTVPDFQLVPVRTKFLENPPHLERPSRFAQMVTIATELSKEFSFVRIDLYDAEDGVYFGEYTFSPDAGCGNFSDPAFAQEFLRKVRCLMLAGPEAGRQQMEQLQ